MLRLIKLPTRRALAGVARLTAVGGASALLCLGAALVAPTASAAPTAPVVNSAAFLAGNPCSDGKACREPDGCVWAQLVNDDGVITYREECEKDD